MKRYGCLSDLVQQDAKTSHANLFKFFKMASAKGFLPKHQGCVVYIRSEGCPKQYKCAMAARLMGILGMIFGAEMDPLINAPHHGKCLVDAIAGRDKYDLCNTMIRGMKSVQRDEFFKLLSEATKAAKFLNEKHATIDVKQKTITKDKLTLSERIYVVSNSEHNSIPHSNSCYYIAKSQFNKSIAVTHLRVLALGHLLQPKLATKKCTTSGLTTKCQLSGLSCKECLTSVITATSSCPEFGCRAGN
jgi:tRNA(Arg) A34 adenosine deaminase TadA